MTRHPLLRLRCANTTTLTDADTTRDVALLDAQEAETYQRFVMPEDRRDYAAAHALLRRTLTSVMPKRPPESWCFERTALGKPHLSARNVDGRPLRFSLSHTRGQVACAISRDGEVGVDAECRSQLSDLDRLMAGVCSADEQAQILAAPPPAQAARFLDLWSLKESYVKACGTGIDTNLAHLTFDLRMPARIQASLRPRSANSWWFALLKPSIDSRIAIAIAPDREGEMILDAAMLGLGGRWAPIAPIRTSGPLRLAGQ